MRSVLISLFFILLFVPIAAAQTTGSLEGTLTDQQGMAVVGASVELVHVATNISKTTLSNSTGNYSFEFLAPGTYAVTVTSKGFKSTTVPNAVVEANKTAVVNVALQLGAITESVLVSAEAQIVNTVDAQVSTNIDQTYLKELPNYSRNVLQYAQLQPGVEIDASNVAGGSQNLNILGTAASVNGNRSQRNDFYLDGMDSENYRNQALQMPNPDTVQEVQVSTSNTSAEYGRQVGGVFNVITKSGTNSFHGTAFYFFRLSDLNAQPYGSTSAPAQKQRTVGGTLGGPIIKKKTFFFFSYERYQDQSARSYTNPFAPTPAMVGGDFTALLAPGPNQHILLDPSTGTACGPRVCGNIILPGAQDPVGQSLVQLLPTVSAYGTPFVSTFAEPAYNRTFYTKMDQRWTDSQSTAFTWMRSSGNAIYPGLDGANFGWKVMPAWGPQTNVSQQDLYNARHTWIIRPTLVADFRVGYVKHHANRDNFAYENAGGTGDDALAFFGASNTAPTQAGARTYLPSIGIGNSCGGFCTGLYGHEGWLGIFEQPSFHFGGTLSWTKSNHNFKFGGDAIRTSQRYGVSGEGQTQIGTFTGRFTSGNSGTRDVGFGVGDLLLGLPDSSDSANGTGGFYQAGVLDYWIHNWNIFYFAQDDWKITPHITLSPGLRYEFYLPPYVQNNQRSEYFDPSGDPTHGSISTYQSTLFATAPQGIAFAGDPGVPGGFYHTQKNLIAPRIGIAWDVKGDGKTAIRGGIGKYFGGTALQTKDWPSEQPPWKPAAECPGDTTLSNPWLGCQSTTFTQPPTPFSSSSAQNFAWPTVFPKFFGFDPNYKTAYSVQWNVTAERQLTNFLTLQVGYIGSQARDLTALQDINWADFGPGASSNGGNVQSRRPNQQFTGIFIATSAGKSSYNALQTVATIKMKDDLQARLLYTYQHGYSNCDDDPVNNNGNCFANPLKISGERGENVFHQTFKFFYVWGIPLLRHSDAWYGKVLGGWQASGNGAFYSGSPMNVTLSDWNFDGIGGDRPDKVGPIHYTRSGPGGVGQYISASAFAAPGGGTNHDVFGTLRRNAVFGPGRWDVDAAMLKNFRITESKYFQFRFEAYNLFNHPNLNNPDLFFGVDEGTGVPTNGHFGVIDSKSGNRLTQIGLKFYF